MGCTALMQRRRKIGRRLARPLSFSKALPSFLAAKVEGFSRLGKVEELDLIQCTHPLKGLADGYEFVVPLLDGDHVTDDAGTASSTPRPATGARTLKSGWRRGEC